MSDKVSDTTVAEWAVLRFEQGWTQQEIAEEYGVSQKTVSVRLKEWRESNPES